MTLEALFADDCALMAHKKSELQLIVNKFAEASRLSGLIISLNKTEILVQSALASTAPPPLTSTEGTKIVEKF